MAAGNADTQAFQAVAVPENNGDHIFQTLAGPKKTLRDRGLVKIILAFGDQNNLRHLVHVIEPATLDKITNILEDEAIG